MKLVNKQNWSYRSMQLFILVAHLVLLKWILYALSEGGTLPFNTVLAHFAGIGLTGAVLIRFCAWYYARRYQKEQQLNSTLAHDEHRKLEN